MSETPRTSSPTAASEPVPQAIAENARQSWRWYGLAILALASGAVLRLAWGQDIEFKHDESFMFQRAIRAGISEPFPWVGMPSGAGVTNPGLSSWIFVAMVHVFRVETPPELARIVQSTNVLALVLSMSMAFLMVSRAEQRSWIWAISLACVNPFAVLFDRKIWAQSVLPIFCVCAIVGWWKRDSRWGAFLWGLVGAWLGQIHMSGFFLAASVLIWTLLGDRAKPDAKARVTVRWLSWTIGSALGALTLLPWIAHLVTNGAEARHQDLFAVLVLHNMFGLWYWILWVTGALGLGMSYSLGATEFVAFLKYPLIFGRPTYVTAVAHVLLFGVGIWLLVSSAWPSRSRSISKLRVLLGVDEPSHRLVMAGFYGCGLLLTAAGFPIFRHYLIVTFPLQWLWLSRQMRLASRHCEHILASVWLCELFISAVFLYYVHVNHGALTGDYGTAYRYQH